MHIHIINYIQICLGTSNSESNSLEQERYLSSIVALTPLSNLRLSYAAWGLSDSSLSVNSLFMAADEDILSSDISRR